MERRKISPYAGMTVKIKPGVKSARGQQLGGQDYIVEDWWENVSGQSWMLTNSNPAALEYAFRAGMSGIPCDNEVLYGKVGPFGFLMHVSELELPEVE